MKYIKKLIIPLCLVCSLVYYSCKDNWEDHNKLDGSASTENLFEKIQGLPDMGKFVQYLKITGYDQVLASSQSYTVWAPVNSAFDNIDTTYYIQDNIEAVADTIKLKKLKQFVSNHISRIVYSYYDTKSVSRILTLSGKYINITNSGDQIEGGTMTTPNDRFCRNGVLHVVNKTLTPKQNIWEYYMSDNNGKTFKTYITQFDQKVFDRNNSRRIGVDRASGSIIYDSLFVPSNRYMLKYGRLDNEDSLYTTILLTDVALQAEKDRLGTFYTMTTQTKSDSILLWNIYKDFVFRGKFTRDNLPGVLSSVDGVNVPVDKSAIVDSYEASNGMVYVLNSCSIPYVDKLKPVVIDVDTSSWAVSSNNSTFYKRYVDYHSSTTANNYIKKRYRTFALNNYDFLFSGYGGTKGVASFPVNLYSNMTYDFYWVAVNDFSAIPLAQSMSLNGSSPTMRPADSIRYTPYPNQPSYSNPVYLGRATTTNYTSYDVKVYSGFGTTNSTTNIVLDYIKIVPVLQ